MIPETDWGARLQFLESVPLHDKAAIKARLQARYPRATVEAKHVNEYIKIMKAELAHAREMFEKKQKGQKAG